MRVSYHNGRADKNGKVYSSKHNDRNFDVNKASHIKNNFQTLNRTWNYYNSDETFEQVEQRFYEEHFSRALKNQNQRYIANRQHGRVKTMNDYLKGKQTCPEEVIIQIGNSKNGNVSPELLRKIFEEQLQWETETFKNVVTLNWALHNDEASPHIHQRKVWIAEDKDGNQIVSQNKALKAMGIERPDQTKVTSKFNNEKQTYTEMCRLHFQELCLQHGLNIETEPIAQSQKSLSITDYKATQSKAKLIAINASLTITKYKLDDTKSKLDDKLRDYDKYSKELNQTKIELADVQDELVKAKSELNDKLRDYDKYSKELNEVQNKLERAIDDVDFIEELRSFKTDVKAVPDEPIQAERVRYGETSGYFIKDSQMERFTELKNLFQRFNTLVAKLDSLVTSISKSLSYLLAKERGVSEQKLNRKEFNYEVESIIKPQIMRIANTLEVDTHKPKLNRIIDDYER